MGVFPRVKQCSTVKELCRKTVINETWRVQLFSCIAELFREDPVLDF